LIGKPLSPEVARRFHTRRDTTAIGPRAVKQIVRVRAPAAGDSRGLAQLLQAYMGEALSMAWGGAADALERDVSPGRVNVLVASETNALIGFGAGAEPSARQRVL